MINNEARDGWILDQVIETSTHIPAGCIMGLLGAKGTSIDSNILVFSKNVLNS